MRSTLEFVDVDNPETWTRYRKGLCDTCAANCCTMPVEARLADLVKLTWVDPFEAENEDPRQIAKRLQKAGLIERLHAKSGIFTLARRADGDCQLLDSVTRRCTVYELRPETCQRHPQSLGPKIGYCPYGRRAR